MDKKLDAKGRWRNRASSFMMSPEEWEDLDTRVRLSGLTKQEYMIRRLLERDVVVQPNTRVFKALRNQMTEILTELRRIENGANVDDELLATIKTVAETYNGLEEKKKSESIGKYLRTRNVVKPTLPTMLFYHIPIDFTIGGDGKCQI